MLTFQIQIILPNIIDSFLENTSHKLPPPVGDYYFVQR